MIDMRLVVARGVVASRGQAVRVRAIARVAVLAVRLVAPEEVALRGGQDAARVVEDELVEDGGDEGGEEVRERGDRGVPPAGGARAPDRDRHEARADVARGVRGEPVRRVPPDDDGVREADDPRDRGGRREEVGRVEARPDDEPDEEVLEGRREDVGFFLGQRRRGGERSLTLKNSFANTLPRFTPGGA